MIRSAVMGHGRLLPMSGAHTGDTGAIDGPWVIVIEDGTWYMFYFGQQTLTSSPSIGFATSDDGVNWTRAACNPILAGDSEGFDATGASSPFVQVSDGTLSAEIVISSQAGTDCF